jgi:hypothetical protein
VKNKFLCEVGLHFYSCYVCLDKKLDVGLGQINIKYPFLLCEGEAVYGNVNESHPVKLHFYAGEESTLFNCSISSLLNYGMDMEECNSVAISALPNKLVCD